MDQYAEVGSLDGLQAAFGKYKEAATNATSSTSSNYCSSKVTVWPDNLEVDSK
jgi:hypothetical protein